jgi:hypothetical protein
MRRLLWAAFLLNIGLNLFSLLILPEKVAMHFGRGGQPDAWATREAHVFWMIVTDIIAFLPLYCGPALIQSVPPRLISLPYKAYWLREENLSRARRMLARFLGEFGLALFSFLFGVTLLAIQATRSAPVVLNAHLFLVLLAVFLVYTVIWTIRLVVNFRPPPET